ncbi:RIP metalloprotease RseP [Marinibactrum halimedae]|uniref:Zinc metalloprotease n=1 Tax=Marinibactrum halimedae TaxID=1444977 RepID=A0AA37T5X3_9GAMM|nr:RIP metalloprotease RseP [Marinibactrum halimedae]MCD9457578.1 RIP metalloprotease RseP [Marinibactrum halimedae]GLS27998.1 putative zinc metalloprotease [Marinibactrum halimedae]
MIVFTILWFLVALGILVTFHEFGHFYIARRCGVKVIRFSVGFGKPLLSWYDRHGTQFSLAAIPLGGYVKMLDEREGPVPDDQLEYAFTRKSVWQRIAIVAAGPVANFILAIVFYWAVFLPAGTDVIPVIDRVFPDSVAEQAGLESGQEILSVDGVKTPTWQRLNQQLLTRLGESGQITFTTKYPDSDLTYTSSASLDDWLKGVDEPNPLEGLGVELYRPKVEPKIQKFTDNSSAKLAGLVAGDVITHVDGIVLEDWNHLVSYVSERPGQTIMFSYERDGAAADMEIVPAAEELESGEVLGRIGIYPVVTTWPEHMLREYRYSIFEAMARAGERTWDTAMFVLMSIKKLIVGEISTKNLSGPITIAKVAGDSAEAGWIYYVEFLALLSVSLGVFNLLPIPVLDGGHLLYYTIEAIKGGPVPERIQMIGYQLGLFLVASIMILAFYNDIMRL